MIDGLFDRLINLFYGTASVVSPSVGRHDSLILFEPPHGMSSGEVAQRLVTDYDIKSCRHAFHSKIDGRSIFALHASTRQRKRVARLMLTMGCLLMDGDLQRMKPFVRGMPKPTWKWARQRRRR